jgi:DNA-binding XRE family transcriptional regulator
VNSGRHYVKIERTPEEQARIDAIRERFQRERPSLDELVASGECEPPISQGEYWDMVEMLVSLRAAREKAGLDRDAVANRIGIDAEFLARLETGKDDPTMDLLRRYAAVLGKQIVLSLADLPQPSSTDAAVSS